MEKISAPELKAKLDAGETLHLLDLRSKEEYAHNHIPGAVNVLVDNLANDLPALFADKKIPLICYFRDTIELQVCEKIAELGYEKVRCLDDGIRAWMEQGFRLEFGEES